METHWLVDRGIRVDWKNSDSGNTRNRALE